MWCGGQHGIAGVVVVVDLDLDPAWLCMSICEGGEALALTWVSIAEWGWCLMTTHIPHGFPTPWVSPHVSYLAPIHTLTRNPSKSTSGGLHPSLEGRGQIAMSLAMEGPK